MSTLDPRLHAYRDDLADSALRGRIAALRFVEGRPMAVAAPRAPLRREPQDDASMESELLMGEDVRVFETTDSGWCWVQGDADSYVGWVEADALASGRRPPTHRVDALSTLAFPGPDLRRSPHFALPLGARVTVTGNASGSGTAFAMIEHMSGEAAVPMRHLAPLDAPRPTDVAAVAERFTGVPYLWGGRSSFGVDCSGLVQVALQACGLYCPRDSDMQEAALGEIVDGEASDVHRLRRGDLIFWRGHVAIVQGKGRLLHANAHHAAVASEALAEALERFGRVGLAVSSVRRMPARHHAGDTQC